MKIGVVGAGWWGKNLVKTLGSAEGVESVVVFDERHEALELFRDKPKTEFASSFESMLSDPAIAGICLATPPPTHFALSKRILSAGKHLLVEKPPAETIVQVEELGRIAAKHNVVYMLDVLYLFLEPVKKIKLIIDSGEINDLKYVQMFRIGDELRRAGSGLQRIQTTMFAKGVNVIDDLFFHDAAILLYLFGDFEFRSVERLCLYHPSLCDTARIMLTARGVPVDLTLSWTLAGRRRGMVLYGEKTVIEYDGLRNENQISRHNVETNWTETFNFPTIAPLGPMVNFYLRCITGKESNIFGASFMEKLTRSWKAVSHEG